MKKLLGIVVLGFLLSGNAYASIIQLEKCYHNKTDNTTDGAYISFFDNEEWSEKNYQESINTKMAITRYVIAVGFNKLPNNISKKEFDKYTDDLLNYFGTTSPQNEKKAEEFFDKHNLYLEYKEFEDVSLSINLSSGIVSEVKIHTDEYIQIQYKFDVLLEEEMSNQTGKKTRKVSTRDKIRKISSNITDYTSDKIFTYKKTNFMGTTTETEMVVDLLTNKIHADTTKRGNNIFDTQKDQMICKPPQTSSDNTGGSSGTAFFVSNRGHLITNNHVVEGCSISKITYKNNDYDTKLIATDKTLDLALLKAEIRPKSFFNFSKDNVKKLNKVYVAGYPLGKGLSDDLKISSGIVSSLKGYKDNSNEIQIDAPINPGNSGGPIINENGDLIAIAVSGLAKDQTEGINFGIKSSAAELFLRSNKVIPKKAMYSGIKDNDKLLEILEQGTVYTYCD
ncbi:trypsin-like peptidase domain-containing protein [Candidatus Pelagibacter sp.]|nr:trypsin-like peptidase domain-containing protein [Candidatus Pelagibacter sp.]